MESQIEKGEKVDADFIKPSKIRFLIKNFSFRAFYNEPKSLDFSWQCNLVYDNVLNLAIQTLRSNLPHFLEQK